MGTPMSERKDVKQASAAPSGEAEITQNGEVAASEPKVPLIESPSIAPTPAEASVAAEAVEPKSEIPKPQLERRSAERVAPAPSDRVVTLFAPAPRREAAPPRANKFVWLAASVAVASAFGALVGVLCAGSFISGPVPAEFASTEAPAPDSGLQNEIARMRSDLAAIKASVETVTRTTTAQLAKFADRIDKSERAQAEPTAKLAKAIEALERLERRAESTKDVTGSVPTAQTAALAANAPRPPQPVQPAQPVIVSGWILQDVYRGVALIQGG